MTTDSALLTSSSCRKFSLTNFNISSWSVVWLWYRIASCEQTQRNWLDRTLLQKHVGTVCSNKLYVCNYKERKHWLIWGGSPHQQDPISLCDTDNNPHYSSSLRHEGQRACSLQHMAQHSSSHSLWPRSHTHTQNF